MDFSFYKLVYMETILNILRFLADFVIMRLWFISELSITVVGSLAQISVGICPRKKMNCRKIWLHCFGSNLPKKLVYMNSRTGSGRYSKMKTLLRAAKNSTLWGAIIDHVLKGHGT